MRRTDDVTHFKAELVAVGMLFLFHDMLEQLPTMISVVTALAFAALGVNTGVIEPETFGQALSVRCV